MDGQPYLRFTLRGLLTLTFIVAAFSLPLARPLGVWLIALPFMASLLAAYVVTRFFIAPLGSRVFWGAFISGVVIFMFAAMFVGSDFVPDYHGLGSEPGVWDEYIGSPLWVKFHAANAFSSNRHGATAFSTNTPGLTEYDYRTFKVFVIIDLAIFISATAALLAQLVVNRRLRSQLTGKAPT